jgi:C4-dicarboxylate transporter DctQ subunit
MFEEGRVRTFISNIEEYALLVLLPAMVVVVLLATLARYTGLFSMFWGEELARYIMVYVAYIGMALAMKRGAHIGVTFITDTFRHPAAAAFFKILRLAIVLAFCGVITWFMSKIIANQMSSGQTSPSLWIPIWIPYAAVPLGMVLMAFRAVEAFVIDWKQSGKEA